MKKAFLLAVLLGGAMTAAYAQNANLGTAGAQFLQIGVGARAAALAGAYVALGHDAEALFWNPAGIASVQKHSFFVAHTPWRASMQLNSAAYAVRMGETGSLGAAVSVLSMDRMEVTTEYQPEGTGEFFDAQDLMISLSFARPLSDRFNAGLTAKYLQQRIWNESASGLAFDVGTQYRLWFNNFIIGMSLSNFGSDLRFDGRDLSYKFDTDTGLPRNRLAPAKLETETYPLPLHFQVGIALDLLRSGPLLWKLATEVTHPNDNSEHVNAGTEVVILDQVFLRGGYRYNYDDEDLNFGFGLALPWSTGRLVMDYAFSRHDLLPDVHRFALALDF